MKNLKKEEIIRTLLDKKADNNNSISLEAYVLGLEDMYQYLLKTKVQ